MRKIATAVLLGAALLLTGCGVGRECIASHYETTVVLENKWMGTDSKGMPIYIMMPVTKQVYVCDEYAVEETERA